MAQYEAGVGARADASTGWWTRERTKRIGLATMLWSFAFAALVFTYNALDVGLAFEAGSFRSMAIYLPHSIAYVLMIAAVLAVGARYGYGRAGWVVVYAFCAALAVAAVGMAIDELAPVVWSVAGPLEAATGLGWFGAHLLATAVGIVLWRMPEIDRLAAALFLATVPLLVVAGVLGLTFGLMGSAALFEMSLVLGAAALGHQLWVDALTRDIEAAGPAA